MKVLIIGSCGYLGSRLGQHLVENGFDVTGVDFCKYGSYRHPRMALIKEDYARLTPEFFQSFERVLLLAGHTSVPLCLGDPNGAYLNNVVNFIDLCAKVPKTRLIYASSASVCNGLFMATEEPPLLDPITVYDKQKKALEELATSNCVGLRFGTLAGWSPNPRLELLVNSMVWDGLNTQVVRASNANILRSVLGTRDACRAIQCLLEASEIPHTLYNLASFSSSVRDVAKNVAHTLGVEPIIANGREGFSFTLDCSLFEDTYNFSFIDSLNSIIDEVRLLTYYDKKVYNRSTNLFKYEGI